MKKKWIVIFFILVVIIAAGALIYIRQQGGSETVDQANAVNPNMTMKVGTGSLQRKITATGNIQPLQEKELFFRSGDVVTGVFVQVGDRVSKGDLLMTLDDRDEKLSLIKAENQYKTVQINGSQSEITEAKMSLDIAKEKLLETELRAPFSGLIIQLEAEEGDLVTGSNVVAKIIDDSSYLVEIDVDESEFRYLELGQQAVITLEALPDQQYRGKLSEIGQSADISSGIVTFPVTVELVNGNQDLRPGFSADLDIIIGQVENQVIIPITAVMNENGQEFVMKVKNGKSSRAPVITSISDGLRVAIESGLEAGEEIVINNGSLAARLAEQVQNGQRSSPTGVGGFRPGGMMGGGRP